MLKLIRRLAAAWRIRSNSALLNRTLVVCGSWPPKASEVMNLGDMKVMVILKYQ